MQKILTLLLLIAIVATSSAAENNATSAVVQQEDSPSCLPEKHAFNPYRHKKVYRVGVHAIRGFEAATREYSGIFADYLSETAGKKFDPPIRFEMKPYLFDGLFEAIYDEEVDFFYANPGIYSCIATEAGASALTTIVSKLDVRGESYDLDVFAGVIMARKDNKAINTIKDIKGKIVGAGSTSMINAGQMQFYEMQKAGVSYVNDPKQVVLTYDQFKIVNGVLDGEFDVGFVRTDTIQRTRDKTGAFVDPDLFKILDPRIYVMENGEVFPFLHSTDVIPEWPVAAVGAVPRVIALEVQKALLAVEKHAFVGKKLQECRTTSSIESCQEMADEELLSCADSTLNVSVCEILVDQKLSGCVSALHTNDCEAMRVPYAFDPTGRCDTTKTIADIAFAASKKGRFAGFRSSSAGYFDVRSMQQEAGFMKQNEDGGWYCPRPSSLYEGIDCPKGFYKRSHEEFLNGCEREGLDCQEGYDCFCKPCVHAFEVDVYEFAEGDIDYHVEDFYGQATEGCDKMSICATVQQGRTITMRAYDNLEREGAKIKIISHAGDTRKELTVTQVEGTFAYEFSLSSKKIQAQVIEVFVDGVQIPQSPIRIMIERLNCDAIYGSNSGRVSNSEGECICSNNTYEMSGTCVESQYFFLIIFSAVIVFMVLSVFVFLTYKKNQNDSVWHINVDELHFNEPPEVIGQGGFGVVILGQYRGTKVAVKRVIPPQKSCSRKGSIQSGDSFDDPLHSGSNQGIDTTKKQTGSKKTSSEPKKTSGKATTGEKYESHAKSKEVKFKACNMTGDVENPEQKEPAKSQDNRGSLTMSGSSNNWEALLRPTRYDNVLKILESATMSNHGSNELTGSFTSSSTDGIIRFLPEFLRFDAHTRLRREFVMEMRLLSRLRHPCITTVMGAVISSNVDPMLVMEYMEYGSLYDLLHNETMTAGGEIILQVIRDIVQGIQFLHASKPPILHGDLKAKNILVDSRFRAKVADFGFSHFNDKKKTNVLQGTPFFMAPEYLTRRSEYNTACDIYSLSMIIYEIYARKDPFDGEDPRKVLPKICHPRVNKRPAVPDACPPKMADIMKKCWSANPFFRPSAKDLDYILVEMSATEAEPLEKDHNTFKDGMKRKPTSLYDVFPKHIADALNAGRRVEPESHEIVTVIFSDIVGFQSISQTFSPLKISNLLDRLYNVFDSLASKHKIFKVETVGDAYMGVTNLDGSQFDSHVKQIAMYAIEAVEAASQILIDEDCPERGTVQIRVGFHSGPVVSNVIGSLNPRYGLFGDTVNTASRMETNSGPGQILCTYASAKLLEAQAPKEIKTRLRGKIQVKGKGKMLTYWVSKHEESDMGQIPPLEPENLLAASPTEIDRSSANGDSQEQQDDQSGVTHDTAELSLESSKNSKEIDTIPEMV